MNRLALIPALAVLALAAGPLAAEAATPQALSSCAGCHDFSPKQAKMFGPPLFALMGAKPRSPGMPVKKWDKKSMDAFLADPEKFKPGTTMPVNVPDAKERAEIIKALAALK